MSSKEEIHPDIWRTCNKIRAAVAQKNVSLWDILSPLDPQKDSLVSESEFCNAVRQAIGLSDLEAAQVAAHFRTNGGRILYRQLCSLIHGQDAPCSAEVQPQWADAQHVRELSQCEERRLCMLLRKLAAAVAARRLILRPYFYDYELVAKNAGTVTLNHFSRVLSFVGLHIASEEFLLLLKKFLKSGYTVNYIAFVNVIENIILDLEKHGELEALGKSAQYPGRYLSAEMPKLPRPELGKVSYPAQATHTALTTYPPDESADQLVRRLQHHVLSEGIRTREVFTDKDPHKTGCVTREQFRCALDMLGVAGTQRLFMSETEIHSLADAYKDPDNESYICWDRFVNDIDKVFTVHGLEKFPCLRVEVPPNGVRDVPRRGAVQPGTPLPKFCQDALDNIKIQLKELSCQLRPGFSNYDKRRCGHVSPEQFRQALQVAGLDVPGDQQTCLLQYFSDDMGFNYQSFLQAVEPLDNPPLYEKYLEQVKRINAPRPGRKPSSQETNIVEIMAKMKSKVVKNRMRIIEFLRNFDRHNQQCISKANFARGLDPLGLQLTPTEVETLAEVTGILQTLGQYQKSSCSKFFQYWELLHHFLVKKLTF
ncbi:uncharacterized protein LOC126354919 isoform X2 [Schistocerca gregaria]|uniref:uncharacterized protein LOC126354919 isoform X2 n=1 Tax=Schistocerca gregaria TaxID=7010 RepID=UPI00211EC626|nr:uncharacterized protein LOC126354919 isoform X2 [Schistocerca gregaria]